MKKGFTLIEIVIAVVIIAVLVTSSIAIYTTISNNNRLNFVLSERDMILTQLDRYYNRVGHPPLTIDEFKAFLKDKSYFATVPSNPFFGGSPEDGWIYYYDATTSLVTVYPKNGS
ncbi:MAG: prepilin-type N-terminal cleavage/methylation domain-containing protein [Conexivisphaerales archaeon]